MREAKSEAAESHSSEDIARDAQALLWRLGALEWRLQSLDRELLKVKAVYQGLAAVESRRSAQVRAQPEPRMARPPLLWRVYRHLDDFCRDIFMALRRLVQGPNWHL
jgi:hypothetical protein